MVGPIDLSRVNEDTTVYSVCEECGESIYSSPYLRARTPDDPWIHAKWGIYEYHHTPIPKVRIVMIVIETFVNGSKVANDIKWNPYVMRIKEVKDVEDPGSDRAGE